jgi:cold shock CspA family protein
MATPCDALTSRWWLIGGYGSSQLVFRALPFLGLGLVGFGFMEAQQQRGSVQPASVVAMLSTRRKGMVKWFNATKRPGCVIPENGNEYTFFHQSPLKSDGYCNLNVGDSVEFDFSTDGDGRLRAVGVTSPGAGAHTGSFHSDGGNHGCAYACYGKDGELGYDGGSSYEGGGSNGSYSCGDEVVSFLVSSGSAAHRVFDEMPHLAVLWDDELQHSSDLHDGLLKQLAEGVDYVDDEEFQNSLDLHDDLLQQGALGRQCTDDELFKWDDDEVLDKIPLADVIWGEEIEHDHDRLPIKASADKLAREVQQYEHPPVFPAAEENVNSKMAENQADQAAAVALDKL